MFSAEDERGHEDWGLGINPSGDIFIQMDTRPFVQYPF
jgi:hypothetical protein